MKDGGTRWDGIRNPEARNNLGRMQPGDRVLVYHSGSEKAVVGTATVKRAALPDAADPRWLAVDLAPERRLARPVTLAEIKADRALATIPLVTRARLSVMPLDGPAFERILSLAGTAPRR